MEARSDLDEQGRPYPLLHMRLGVEGKLSASPRCRAGEPGKLAIA
jgi:hypothetical protein